MNSPARSSDDRRTADSGHAGLLRKLPGTRRAPAGLEWAVLRRLPMLTVIGTVLPMAAGVAVTLFADGDAAGAKLVTTAWIAVASALVLHWTVMFTLALACAIVWIAKGPAYVADAYELIDSDRPAPAGRAITPARRSS